MKIYADRNYVDEAISNAAKGLATEAYVDETVGKIDLSTYMTMPYEWVETAQGDRIAEGETMASSFITDLDAAKEVASSINTSSKALSELFRQINMMFYPTSYNNVIYKNVVSNILAEFNVLKENQYITNSVAITTYHYCRNNREFNDIREWKTYKITYASNTNQINITDGSDMYKYITFNAVTGAIEANFIPVTDTVLTQAKKPADAAAVGTAIAEAKAYAIPAPATATVGQTVVVKAVDENGKPTEWEAVELTANANGIKLVDRTTSETYNVYIDNGKLTMEAV